MKITISELRCLIREMIEKKPQKGDDVFAGDDWFNIDNNVLRLLSNVATTTVEMKDVPRFQIRQLKDGIRFIETRINIEGIISALEIEKFTNLDISTVVEWMFRHGASKMKRQKKRPAWTIYN